MILEVFIGVLLALFAKDLIEAVGKVFIDEYNRKQKQKTYTAKQQRANEKTEHVKMGFLNE